LIPVAVGTGKALADEANAPPRRRQPWHVVAAVAVLVTVAVAAFLTAFYPTRYSVTAQSFVTLAPRPPTDSDPFAGSQFVLQRMATYAGLATSNQVLAAVTARMDLPETPDQLRAEVTSTSPPNTVLLEVVVSDKDPQRAARIADAVAAAQGQAIESLEAQGAPTGSSPVTVTPISSAAVPHRVSAVVHVLRQVLLGLGAGLVVGVAGALVLWSRQRPPAASPWGSPRHVCSPGSPRAESDGPAPGAVVGRTQRHEP
jgi:succinoglycan biosynthesis transport protein ExoP